MRQRNLNLWTASYGMTLGLVMAAFGGQMAAAQGLSYQKANDQTPNIFPSTAYSLTVDNTDNLWGLRGDFGTQGPFGTGEVWEAGITEDVPELRQLVSGLTPNTSYDLYAAYWTDDDENWTIRAGTTSGNLTLYSFNGDHRSQPVAGSTIGLTAGAAIWDSPPPPTDQGTTFTEPRVTEPVQPFDDPLVMLLGYAGRVTSNGAGEIDVFVDDLPQSGAGNRTWFDGVAYRPASDTPLALTASVNRDTGAITVNNATATNFQITSYTVDSINGGLDATEWSTINDTDPTWTIAEPVDPANTPYATLLTENGGNNFTIAASGGSLDVGDVWINSPFEDVRVYLTLADGTLAVISPEYTGGETILLGDFNVDGAIDLTDYQTLLSSMHTDVLGTNVERHQQGDMTVNGAVNFDDFAAFRIAFDEANGAGTFAQMAAQVPEPSTAAMLLVMGALALGYARRRAAGGCLALVTCLLLTGSSQAATLLKVDVDARAGDSTAGPEGPNTVDGFSSYTMEAGTTGALGTSTNTVNGYSITLTAVDATGNPAGGFEDRDRAQPTTTPTLNQLYDDFIFANVTTTGEGGGLDMMINSGGALMPNTSYFFTLYAWDVSSTGVRSADWLDGNAGNAVAFSTSFDGSNAPATDEQYSFVGNVQTDGSGNLLLRARETAPASHGVFINGFEISDEPPPGPVELTLEVNTTTGAVQILNQQGVSFDMSYYEIRSAAGSLNLTGWTSLDDTEGGGGAGDYNGDGSIDAADYTVWRDTQGQNVTPGTGADGDNSGVIDQGDYTVWHDNFGEGGGSDPIGSGWDEVPNSTANILSEVNLQAMDTFDPTDTASLGNAFSVGGTQDLEFFYAGPADGVLRLGLVEYVTSGSGTAAAVPEPSTLSLLGLAVMLLGVGFRRRQP